MKDVKNKNTGFSLLEVLIALSILSIGMLATGALAVGIISGNKRSKDLTTATILAQDKIESIREAGYANLPSSDGYVTEDYNSIVYAMGGNTADYASFKRITTLTVDSPFTGMKEVNVSVYRRSGQLPVTIKTYFAE